MPKYDSITCPVCARTVRWDEARIWVPKRDENGALVTEPSGQVDGKYEAQGLHDPASLSAAGDDAILMRMALGRPLQCPMDKNFLGEGIDPHDLPEGIFDRPSTIVGFVGPTSSSKSTLLGLMAHHAGRPNPNPFREAGLSFEIERPERGFRQNYGELVVNQGVEPTPSSQPAPWVTLQVSRAGGEESNLILCDSAGENFNGRISPDGYGSAAVKDMPFLFGADVLAICVPASFLGLAPRTANDFNAVNGDPIDHLMAGINFLIRSQRTVRSVPAGADRPLPWVCVLITKADTVTVDGDVSVPELSPRYETHKSNVSYGDLHSELTRILEESASIRSWIKEHDIDLFDKMEDNCQSTPFHTGGTPPIPLFRGISYHLVTARSGGTNENGLFEPGATHNRLLDLIALVVALMEANAYAAASARGGVE